MKLEIRLGGNKTEFGRLPAEGKWFFNFYLGHSPLRVYGLDLIIAFYKLLAWPRDFQRFQDVPHKGFIYATHILQSWFKKL